MIYQGFSLDIEADGFIFESNNIWTVVCTDLNDMNKKVVINPFKDPLAKQKLFSFLCGYTNPYITWHYGLGYDAFVLLNLLDCKHTVGPDTFMGMPVQFVDTFYMSMYLNPDRAGHSVEWFGEKLGLPKLNFRQELIDIGFLQPDAPKGQEFMQHHPLMDTYCIRDTEVDVKIFHGLCKEWESIYGVPFSHTQSYKCGQKSFYLMSCQELAGWKFDQEEAKKLAVRIDNMMEEIRSEVEPKLPPRALKKTEEKDYTMPAKPFKKDGSFSSTWEKFVAKHNAKLVGDSWEFYGKLYKPEAGKLLDVTKPMEMANQDQMKDWFLEQNWEPTLWNFKKGPDGKPMRDPKTRQLIKSSPKIQEQGKICKNLLEMETGIVADVVKWLSLRNRRSVLQGWIDNPRLKRDGRIGAGRTGIAATHRQKHSVVVNVPKASEKVLLGHEFRSLWTSEDGFLIAAADAAALEGRVQAHYTWKYDDGATAKELLEGDIHCFSEDTEILTDCGWMKFNDLEGKKVAQWENGNISFVYPKETVWSKYSGEMIAFNSSSMDQLVTLNHRVLVNNIKKQSDQVIFADALSDKNSNLMAYTAGFVVGGTDLSPDLAEMIVAVQSDSHISDTSIRFEFVKERKIERMQKMLEALNIEFTQYEGKSGKTIRINIKKENIKDVLSWVDSEKNLSTKLLGVSKTTAEVIVNSYGFWDGTYRDNGDIILDTTSSQTIDVLQGLCALSGKKSTVTRGIKKVTAYGTCLVDRIYVSSVSRPLVGFRNTKSVKKYDGYVGCVVVGSGFIVVRKGDCVVVSGNSKTAKSVYEDELAHIDITAPDFNKDDPFFKPFRDRSKNVFYAGLYGAGDAKIASTAGLPEYRGKEISEKFWAANPATKQLKDNLEKYWKQVGKEKYLPAIDGRMLCTRKKSALLNTIFQSCGGIAMDYALCFMDHWLGEMHWEDRKPYYLYKGYKVRRIGYTHDEAEFEAEEPIAKEIGDMIVRAITKAGEFLKIKVPLAGEAKVGHNWKETH